MTRPAWFLRLIVPVVAVGLCVGVGLATRLPSVSATERDRLVARFGFDRGYLNDAPASARDVRAVQPRLHHIRHWISSVGAGVGLADLDGDGLPNERCLVDPRDDSVTLGPVPTRPGPAWSVALIPGGTTGRDTTAPMGCVPVDLNEDGYTDLVTYFWGRTPLAYLRVPSSDLSAGSFRPTEIGQPGEVWNTNTLNAADVDGDGHLDLVVGNYFPDGARVLDPAAAGDPHMRMQDSMSLARNGGRNRILRFAGLAPGAGGLPAVPRFEDASAALTDEQARAWTLAIGAQDLDGDALAELYFANDFGPDHLLLNRSTPGRVRFVALYGERDPLAPKSKVVGRDSFKGMGVAFDDLNRDNRPDLLVSNITSPYALHESNFAYVSDGGGFDGGRAPYRDESNGLGLARSGWGWDIKAADFDADGRKEIVQAIGFLAGGTNRWAELQELALANDDLLDSTAMWPNFVPGDKLSGDEQNPFYVRAASGRYVDVSGGLDFTNPGVSRGLAVGDVDHDGRLDLAVANQWARSTFFHNRAPARAFLGLSLVLPGGPGRPDRPAVGARATVTRADGTLLSEQLYPANGHTGVNAPELFFGLGEETGAVPVTVSWRDAAGRHEVTRVLAPGWHTLVLTRS